LSCIRSLCKFLPPSLSRRLWFVEGWHSTWLDGLLFFVNFSARKRLVWHIVVVVVVVVVPGLSWVADCCCCNGCTV
jgi:hypothetical protein